MELRGFHLGTPDQLQLVEGTGHILDADEHQGMAGTAQKSNDTITKAMLIDAFRKEHRLGSY